MKIKILFMMSCIGLMFGCDQKQKETAQRTIDSLQTELQVNQKITGQLAEIGTLIDSIDINRHVLRTTMAEGTSYGNYVNRMRDINEYVKRTKHKIEVLEEAALKSHDAAYANVIRKLKSDLSARNQELVALTEQVKLYRNQNDNLVNTVSLQKAEIKDKLDQIKLNQQENADLEKQVSELLVQAKLDQGEAFFGRAVAVEEAANRTHFAPRKKKNTMREALELYKQAQVFGKDEAQAKIDELEKRLVASR